MLPDRCEQRAQDRNPIFVKNKKQIARELLMTYFTADAFGGKNQAGQAQMTYHNRARNHVHPLPIADWISLSNSLELTVSPKYLELNV